MAVDWVEVDGRSTAAVEAVDEYEPRILQARGSCHRQWREPTDSRTDNATSHRVEQFRLDFVNNEYWLC